LAGACGCNPYHNLDGDFYVGPVDATHFPDAYLGAGFDGAGSVGTISPSVASVAGGASVAYYMFPVTAGVDPTVLRVQTATATRERALVYVFDGGEALDSSKCTPPAPDYVYDVQRDFVRFDREGNVFQQPQTSRDSAALPDGANYMPIYAEVPVASMGEGCQSIHSAEGLVQTSRATVQTVAPPAGVANTFATGVPDGKYVAWAMIDPRAIVRLPDGSLDANGMGPQRWGWYNHFLAAYVEGGYVPTQMATVPGQMGAPDQMVVQAQAATLYAPNTFVDSKGATVNCDSAAPTDPNAPCIGNGFDVLDGFNGMSAARGEAGYSPLCHVLTFTPADPKSPPASPADIDPQTIDPDSGTFVYCLQVSE
jgi:hypothetical protein